MALGDATNFTLENYGKKIIMEAAVDYTGSGATSTTQVRLAVGLNPIAGGGETFKYYLVNFSSYTNGVGVQIGGIQVTDIPAGYKLNSFTIRTADSVNALIPITLTPIEQIEFPDGGILYIAKIALDAVGGLA